MFSYEYNIPIRFDGDIIITDPCYIINRDNDDKAKYPSWTDYLSKATYEISKDGEKIYHMPKATDYPDVRKKSFEDCFKEAQWNHEKAKQLYIYYQNNNCLSSYISPTLNEEFERYQKDEGDYIRADHNDWDRCRYGDRMQVLGLSTFLCASTIYGDWSCTTYNIDTKEKIGEFCADSGQVGVFLLDEVLRYNPKFDYHINRPWTTTLIKDFHGTVELKKDTVYDADGDEMEDEIKVIGTGNVNFKGIQTGF